MRRIVPIVAVSLALSSSSEASAQNETGPVRDQPVPVPSQTAPQNQPPPVQDQSAPVENQPAPAPNQPPPAENHTGPLNTKMNIYGYAMTDTGYNFGRIDPLWFDVMRPTKLPAVHGEFGANGDWFFGVRQSRFGVKTETPTPLGDFKTIFEFELFGVGNEAGETTFRLRHAWGELGHFGAGQTWSVFMDPDVFPNSIEYWGPNGMVFYRNVQVRWMPLQGPLSVAVAIERPGSTQDTNGFEETLDIQNVSTRFPLPDFTGHIRYDGDWGHIQLAGIARYIRWDPSTPMPPEISGHAVGWGASLSTKIKFLGESALKLEGVYGRAMQAYMNDGGPDIGIETNGANPAAISGTALPIVGALGFVDIGWCPLLTSSVGYSIVWIDNSSGQQPDAFKLGQYALGNLLVHPLETFFFGAEFQWGERQNKSDGWTYGDYRVQFSAQYKFSKTLPL
jgi:hypothetical protein